MIRTLRWISPGLEAALRRLRFNGQFRAVAQNDLARVGRELSSSWMDEEVPEQQRALVNREIELYRTGHPVPAFDALVDILKSNIEGLADKSLLEIGCSSGYYSEVLSYKGGVASYRGCDFSPAFVRLARQTYPSIQFDVEDATSLSYGSDSVDIVISGCCLLHIYDYQKAIAESARVARGFVVFHRTPVLHRSGPAFYKKKAYGVEMMEIHFNEQELLKIFRTNNLGVVDINSRLSPPINTRDDILIYKTYLCRKLA